MRLSLVYLVVVVSLLGLAGCKNSDAVDVPSYLVSKEVPDWNEIYPLLIISAQKWDVNAGLRLAVLEINSNKDPGKRLVSAFFETPNEMYDFLHVQYLVDGSINTEILTHGVPISNFDLIDDTKWALNSTDAWNIFLQVPDVASFGPAYFDCATLVLINRKLENQEEKRVLWQLAMDDCAQGGLTLFFVDAHTGELLGKESY